MVLIWEALLSICSRGLGELGCDARDPHSDHTGATGWGRASLARSHREQPGGRDLAPMGAAGGAKAFGRCQGLTPATLLAIFQGRGVGGAFVFLL